MATVPDDKQSAREQLFAQVPDASPSGIPIDYRHPVPTEAGPAPDSRGPSTEEPAPLSARQRLFGASSQPTASTGSARDQLFPSRGSELLANAGVAADLDPNEAARTLRLKESTALPEDLIFRNADEIEKASRVDGVDWPAFAKSSPLISEWLSESPHRVAATWNDLPKLGKIDDFFRRPKELAPLPEAKLEEMARRWAQDRLATEKRATPEGSVDPTYMKALEDSYVQQELSRLRKEEEFISGEGPVGVFEMTAKRFTENPFAATPFMHHIADGTNALSVYNAAQAMTEKRATPAQVEMLTRLARLDAAAKHRGSSFMADVASVVGTSAVYGAEFAITGGAYTAVKGLIYKRGALEAAKGVVQKGMQMALASAGWAAGSATQAALTAPLAAPGKALERSTPQGELSTDEQGNATYTVEREGKPFSETVPKAVLEHMNEIASERMGGLLQFLGKPIAKLAGPTLQKWITNPANKYALGRFLFQQGESKAARVLSETVEKAGFNGLPGEVFEERMNEVLNYVTGVSEKLELPSAKQLATEVTAFAIPGGLRFGINAVTRAESQADRLKRLGENVKEMELYKTAPKVVEQLFAHAAEKSGRKNLIAPIDSWISYWQEQGKDPADVAEEIIGEGGRAAFEEAKKNGTDLPIPVSRYAVTIAPSEHNAFWAKELKEDYLDKNVREAQEEEEAKKVEATAKQAEAEAPQDDLRKRIDEHLSGINFDESTRQPYAQTLEGRARARAKLLGADPVEFWEREKVAITGQDAQPTPADPSLEPAPAITEPEPHVLEQERIKGTSIIDAAAEFNKRRKESGNEPERKAPIPSAAKSPEVYRLIEQHDGKWAIFNSKDEVLGFFQEKADASKRMRALQKGEPPSSADKFAARFDAEKYPKAVKAIKKAQDPKKGPYVPSKDVGDIGWIPNFASEPTGVIGPPGISQPFGERETDPFKWPDAKYEVTKTLIRKHLEQGKDLVINTSSDLVARIDYIEFMPPGTVINMYLLSPREELNRILFPGNASRQRQELAVAALRDRGFEVNAVEPTVESFIEAFKDRKRAALSLGVKESELESEVAKILEPPPPLPRQDPDSGFLVYEGEGDGGGVEQTLSVIDGGKTPSKKPELGAGEAAEFPVVDVEKTKAFAFKMRDGYLLMPVGKDVIHPESVYLWLRDRGVGGVKPIALSEVEHHRELIDAVSAKGRNPHLFYEITEFGATPLNVAMEPHPDAKQETFKAGITKPTTGRGANYAFTSFLQIKSSRFGTPEGNLWLSSASNKSGKTTYGVGASKEEANNVAVDGGLKFEEPTPRSLMDLEKPPKLVVGANNFLRNKVPFFLLQQYDLFLFIHPSPEGESRVGILSMPRMKYGEEKYLSVFGSDINKAIDSAIGALLIQRAANLDEVTDPENKLPARDDKAEKRAAWLTHWIYRQEKVSLKALGDADTVLHQDPIPPDSEIERLRTRLAETEAKLERAEKELRTSPLTGLRNKRAFDEDESLGWPGVAAVDMDGLKRLNDYLGHELADTVLKQLGGVFLKAEGQGDNIRFYHRSGDEFAVRFKNAEEAEPIMAELQKALDSAILSLKASDGRRYLLDGIGISFGTGESYEQADLKANDQKRQRLAEGKREDARVPGQPRRLREIRGREPGDGEDRGGSSGQPQGSERPLSDDVLEQSPKKRFTDRIKRAEKMGFDTSTIYYHGTKADIGSFSTSMGGTSTGVSGARNATFFSSDPKTAGDFAEFSASRPLLEIKKKYEDAVAEYELYKEKLIKRYGRRKWWSDEAPLKPAERKKMDALGDARYFLYEDFERVLRKEKTHNEDSGQNLIPVFLKTENPYRHDADGARYRDIGIGEILERAREGGFDSVIISNVVDSPYTRRKAKSTVVAVFDPTQVRSVNARFKDEESDNILAQDDEKGPRGTYNRVTRAMTLGSGADASTLIHEGSHIWLDEMARDYNYLKSSNQTGVFTPEQQQFMKDAEAVLKYLGVSSFAEIRREHHEKWAKTGEKYFLEGIAPSEALRGPMARFAEMLFQIYRDIKDEYFKGIEINPEIRGVFDRLIATQEEIEAAQAEQNMAPLFPDQHAGVVQEIKQQALAEVTRKDLERRLRERERIQKGRRDEIRAEVAKEINERREYIALSVLQHGTLPDGSGLPVNLTGGGLQAVKLSRSAIEAQHGKDRLKKLPRPYVYTREGGMAPDDAAWLFGFSSGDELLTALETAPNRKTLIEEETDRRLKAESPDMMEDGTLAVEAMKSVHNDKRAELLRRELELLNEKRPGVMRDLTKRVARPLPAVQEVRARAEKLIRAKAPRDINPFAYQRAEAKAAREAMDLLLKGDFEGAFLAKERELTNHELYRAAVAAKERVDKVVDYMVSFDKPTVRERIGKAGHDYLEQIDSIRERYDFRRSPSLKAIDKRKSLLKWAKEQAADGQPVDIPEKLLLEAERRHYKDVPYGELLDINDTVEMITHLATTKNKLLTSKDRRNLMEAMRAIVGAITAHHKVEAEPFDFAPDFKKKLFTQAKEIMASHTKMEFFFEFLDGNKRGPVWDLLFRPMVEAEAKEIRMMRDVDQSLARLFSVYSKKERQAMFTTKQLIPAIGTSLTKANMLAVALNWGNEYNRTGLMEGYGWTEAQVEAILDQLDERDVKFVQSVWDYIDTFWPEIEAQEKLLRGVAPQKVQATPWKTKFGEMRGGYYPVLFDGKQSWRQMKLDEKASVEQMFGGNWARAMTLHGHTIERSNTGGKPFLLEFTGLTNHLTNVVHDLAFRPAIIDVSRLIGLAEVRKTIEAVAGREMYKQLNPWLMAIAGDRPHESVGWIEKLMGRARTGATVVNMGLKITTALVQMTGYTVTVKELGPKYAALGVRHFYNGGWQQIKKNWAFIVERSAEQANRPQNFDREVKDYSRKKDKIDEVQGSYFRHISIMDLGVVGPSWMGAYLKAFDGMVENVEKGNEKEAALYADQVIRQTQGSGLTKDLAGVQRGTNTVKLFTMFFSFWAVLGNQLKKTKNQYAFDKNKGALLGSLTMLWFLPAVLDDLILGRGPDGDDDLETWLRWFAKKQVMYPFQSVILLRDLVNGMDRFGYEPSAAFDAFEQTARTLKAGFQVAFDEDKELSRADVKGAVMAAGYIAGLPARQVWLTAEYLHDYLTGEIDEFSPWQMLVTGKPREK
jgi:GGDEF domain-containing protein